MKREVSLLTG